MLSGGLAGHVHGTGAYDLTSTGEPAGWRPYIWDALRFVSGGQMRHLATFVLSEQSRYQQLLLASEDLRPRKAPGAREDGLDGWAFMMRTADRDLALLYFEKEAPRGTVAGLRPASRYRWIWFDPRQGRWLPAVPVTSARGGSVAVPRIPDRRAERAGGLGGEARAHAVAAFVRPRETSYAIARAPVR